MLQVRAVAGAGATLQAAKLQAGGTRRGRAMQAKAWRGIGRIILHSLFVLLLATAQAPVTAPACPYAHTCPYAHVSLRRQLLLLRVTDCLHACFSLRSQ